MMMRIRIHNTARDAAAFPVSAEGKFFEKY
jgi:hypothetical protein